MTKETGGPAFPVSAELCQDLTIVEQRGMTLRDYFAAKAMQAFLMQPASITAPDEMIAEAAYDTADAMLKAREA